MALIACPDCGHQVSDQAYSCPECGRPLRALPPQVALRQEARVLQSLTMGCGCLLLLLFWPSPSLGFCSCTVSSIGGLCSRTRFNVDRDFARLQS